MIIGRPIIMGTISSNDGYELFVCDSVTADGAMVFTKSRAIGAGSGSYWDVITTFGIDASQSSPIYGSSDTVQPSSSGFA